MLKITDIISLKQVYDYQMRLSAPCFLPVDFGRWKESFENDTDGEGRTLFKQLWGKAAYDGEALVGFVQYGYTAFGFDECGEISSAVSYPVIRSLYFNEGREDAGKQLLQAALQEFAAFDKVYAFFHYFGMGCFARHGKLFERFAWIRELLHAEGFAVEHENVYYSAALRGDDDPDVAIIPHNLTKGAHQTFDFMLDQNSVGGCEVHYLDAKGIAYLRWIYINDVLQNQGIGSRCMHALKAWLWSNGISRLDTDTALDNCRAQHYYEKNGFAWEGITRSFYLTK